MSILIEKDTARNYLHDVEPMWRAFWFHPHLMAKNLEEFLAGLKEIDAGVYLYHARGHKNDFSKWVREVVGDGELADKLEKVRIREDAIRIAEQHIKALKKIASEKKQKKKQR
jgi:hypothetical protein